MKIKVQITLTDDRCNDYTEDHTEETREIQLQIEESLPEGFQNLDKWEENVHKMGFQTMRELFKGGIKLYEERVYIV